MATNELLQSAIDRFWDTVPPVWGRVRENARSNAICDFRISLIQFHILRHIRHGAHSVSDLADRLQISRPAISQAVDTLVEKELVTRRQNKGDRRFVQLELTESGNHLINTIFSQNRLWMGEKMSALSPNELETIICAMTILKSTFDAPEK
jgi:DNA-binding MarR family transcriptional regulator